MPEAESPPPNPAKGRIVLWLAALGVPLLLLLAWWPSGKTKARPALPNPNGYDYFVKAGESLAGMWMNRSYRSLSAEDLQGYLSANQASLELVREGLRHRSQSRWEYGTNHLHRMFGQWNQFRKMGGLLVGAGWLAELESKPADAADGYLDAMTFGQECSRGGLFTERLVGIAIEAQALDALRPLAPHLDVTCTRKVFERLTQLDASHDPFAANSAAEDDWVSHSFPPWQRLMGALHPRMRKELHEQRRQIEERINMLQATRRRAIVEAAARLFELEKGRRPTGYADLVPAYLKAIPLDPTTGKEIVHPF